MQLISKCSKLIRVLLCVIDVCSNYAWVIYLKDKKEATIVNALGNILVNSKRKPSKTWVYQGSDF